MQTRNDAPLAWIDVLRGVAVTLVIASHAMPVLPELPWTIKRVSNLGFFGVQLFFVVSCFTLVRSWRRRERSGPPSLREFALRRIFRIVPAYFLAALLYWWLLPHPPAGAERLATFATFTSGWSPAQMPTVLNVWVGVPGGWSVAAEMSFYVIFPLLVSGLRGLRPAAFAALASLPLAWLANAAARAHYASLYGAEATEQFLYYWLPNQMPVFLIGLAVYEGSDAMMPGRGLARFGAWLTRRAQLILGLCMLGFLLLGWATLPRLPEPRWGFLYTPALAAMAFGGAAWALQSGRVPWASPAWLASLGQASFSAYLLHFAVIDIIRAWLPARVTSLSGVAAGLASLCIFAGVLLATAALSRVTYFAIELPGIRLGNAMAHRWATPATRLLAKR